MIRRLLCAVGLHRWQYLLAPPTWRKGDGYEPGIFCIFCDKRGPRGPGDGAVASRFKPPSPEGSHVATAVSCG